MTIQKYRIQSATDAKFILESGLSTLESLSAALTASAPYQGPTALSTAEAAFVTSISSNVEAPNATVDAIYKTTRDAATMATANIRTLERFIGLHVPQMEDGNNFGVTVQMMMTKFLKEERERCDKVLSESSKYYSNRIQSMFMLMLPDIMYDNPVIIHWAALITFNS
eukprot:scaffold4568_cov74-Cyclotella_meneghiniana.AAC.12